MEKHVITFCSMLHKCAPHTATNLQIERKGKDLYMQRQEGDERIT